MGHKVAKSSPKGESKPAPSVETKMLFGMSLAATVPVIAFIVALAS